MKRFVFLRTAVLAAVLFLPLLGLATSSKPQTITRLDGSRVVGVVEIADDYTIRVTGDTGIQNILIATLGEGDFQKYGFFKDRSHDGKFWYQRQIALEASHANIPPGSSPSTAGGGVGVAAPAGETDSFQPLIAAYEQTLSGSNATSGSSANLSSGTDSASGTNGSTSTANDAPIKLFSGSGGLNSPFSSGFNSSVVQPVESAAAAAASGATSTVPGVP